MQNHASNSWFGAYLNVYTNDNDLIFSETLGSRTSYETHELCFSVLAKDNPYTIIATEPTAQSAKTWSLSGGWVDEGSVPGTVEIDFSLG